MTPMEQMMQDYNQSVSTQGLGFNPQAPINRNKRNVQMQEFASPQDYTGATLASIVTGLGNQERINQANAENTALRDVMAKAKAYQEPVTTPVSSTNVFNLSDSNQNSPWGKVVSNIESGGAQGYNTPAHKISGARGMYQIVPSTANEIIKKNNLTQDYAWSPAGQDFMFNQNTKNNYNYIAKDGYKPTAFDMWVGQNLGMGNARKSTTGKGEDINPKYISANLPKGIKPTWENYKAHWEPRFSGL